MRHAVVERQTIEDGRTFDVVVAFTDDPAAIECGDGVAIGDLYIGGGFSPRAGVLLAAEASED